MFYFDNFYGKKILRSSFLEGYDCFFTTRDFPLIQGALEEIKTDCEKNQNLLMEKLKSKNIYKARQVHGNNIETVKENNFFYDNTDGLISTIKDSLLVLNFADCVPIILYSKEDNVGALVHAGWRGTASEIASKTVQKLKDELNINPRNIIALIGPSIGKCCFETDEDVFEQLIKDKQKKELYRQAGNKYFIDLKMINRNQLIENGIQNIDISDYCTCCMSDIFFSYRKEKGITARHSAVLKIRGDK